MTLRQRFREWRAWLVGGFLADPTHISLGLLGLVVAWSLIIAAPHAAPLPPFLLYGWAAGLALSGLGKVGGPYLVRYPAHEDTARGLLLASSILAGTCWGTIAIGALFLGPGASLAVLQAFFLSLGAFGRVAALRKTTAVVDEHAREE